MPKLNGRIPKYRQYKVSGQSRWDESGRVTDLRDNRAGMRTRVLLAVILSVAIQSQAQPQSAGWPQFRGPNAAGVAADTPTPVEFGPGKSELWNTPVPAGVSSPCVAGDRIFLTAFDAGKLLTICLSRADGRILWTQPLKVDRIEKVLDRRGSPASATPACDGSHVYVYFSSFGLICYDLEGHEAWRHPLPLPFQEFGFGSGTSPIVSDGKVLLNRDADKESELLALDAKTGEFAWRTRRPDFRMSWSTPVIWRHDDVTEVVIAGQQRVKAYDLKDGTERWLVRGLPNAVCTTPVLGDGMLYIAAWSTGSGNGDPMPPFALLLLTMDKNKDGKLSMDEIPDGGLKDFWKWFDADNDGFITAEEYAAKIDQMHTGHNVIMGIRSGGHGDVTDTHVAWSQFQGVPYVASPLFYRGRLLVVKDGGLASCFDAKTGKPFFQQKRLEAGGEYYASPVAADGRIYTASVGGTVLVLDAADTLTTVAKNVFDEKILATPAIVEGRIYLRTAGHLWAFGK